MSHSDTEALMILQERGIPRIAGGSGEDEGDQSASEVQETPDDHGTLEEGEAAEAPDIDYQQRYDALRPEFDRRSQELSQAQAMQEALSGQAGPEAQAEALRGMGIELEADDEQEFDHDPDSRLDRLEQTIEQQQADAEQQRYIEAEQDFVVEGIESLEQREGREFSEQEIAVLASVARANRHPDGTPNLSLAHDHLTDLLSERQSAWIESKKAPRRPGAGTVAGKAVDLDNPEVRVAYMAERFTAAEE